MEKQTAIELINKLLQSRGIKEADRQNFSQSEIEFANNHIYLDFCKSNLYVINFSVIDSKEQLQNQSRLLREFFEKTQITADHVFILHLLLTDQLTADTSTNWLKSESELESEIIELVWFLDYSLKKLIFPSDQPTTFLNLEKELPQVLDSGQVEAYVMETVTKPSYISYGFILINLIMWLIEELIGGSWQIEVLLQLGAMNVFLIYGGEWYRLLTAMFLHIGWMHLAMNSAGIYIFGSRLEKRISAREFLIIYVVGGLMGNLVSFGYHVWVGNIYVVVAGASGGVYALMGALLSITYFTKRKAGGLDAYAIFTYFLIGLISSAIDVQIDLAAHLGGFITGFLLAFLSIRKYKQLV